MMVNWPALLADIMRILSAAAFLIVVIVLIGSIFWQTELKYTRPTPVPKGYQEVYVNDLVYIHDSLKAPLEKPVFYHFFTTNCPCSRFNLTHFNFLKSTYGSDMDFYVVIPDEDEIDKARPYFEGITQIIRDVDKKFAVRSGVYSTPQAVIIDINHRLYFRGNYNKARYCIDPSGNFAQMAIDSIRSGADPPVFGPLSYIAYGCGVE